MTQAYLYFFKSLNLFIRIQPVEITRLNILQRTSPTYGLCDIKTKIIMSFSTKVTG